MTHPTYTHPGVNAALLAISRTRRRLNLAWREFDAWQFHTRDNTVSIKRIRAMCAKRVSSAVCGYVDANATLGAINRKHSK
jgi:hypothetical protein